MRDNVAAQAPAGNTKVQKKISEIGTMFKDHKYKNDHSNMDDVLDQTVVTGMAISVVVASRISFRSFKTGSGRKRPVRVASIPATAKKKALNNQGEAYKNRSKIIVLKKTRVTGSNSWICFR